MDDRSTPWLLGGLLVLAGVGVVHAFRSSSGAKCSPSIKAGDRILLVGDSLAVGLGVPGRTLASKTGCDFDVVAEVSTTMAQWLSEPRKSRLASALANFQPTLVLVSLGTNDSVGSTSAEKLETQVAALTVMLTSGGAALVWVAPPKLPFADRVGPLAKSAGLMVFDSAKLPLQQVDGIHPNASGYAGWGEHIWAMLTCSEAPQEALTGLSGGSRPVLPSFMVPARVGRVPLGRVPGRKVATRQSVRRRRRAWRV